MRLHKVFCVAALVLMAASLLLVATDGLLTTGTQHGPGTCPVCTWASSLAVAQVPLIVTWVEHTILRWTPREPRYVFHDDFFCRPFSARSPPAAENA